MPQSTWETKSRRELDQIIEQCRSLASRMRAQGALAKCMGGQSFFSPAQQAAGRLEQAAEIVHQFLTEGPDKDSRVVTNCVNRLMKSIGFSGEEAESPAKAYDPGEFSGHSRAMSVPEMLEFLSLMNKTGFLEVATDQEHFTLELQSGEVVHASSTNAPAGDRLGEILVAQGSLTEEQLQSFLSGKNKGKLGKALQDGDLISPEALSRALSQQIQQLFTRLFTAEEAYFIFREGTPQNADTGLSMNVTGLLLESASKLDERGRDADAAEKAEAAEKAQAASKAEDAEEAGDADKAKDLDKAEGAEKTGDAENIEAAADTDGVEAA